MICFILSVMKKYFMELGWNCFIDLFGKCWIGVMN